MIYCNRKSQILLIVLAILYCGLYASAHNDFSGYVQIRGADCNFKDRSNRSIVVQVLDVTARTSYYEGSRNAVDPSKGFKASGFGSAYRIIGFPDERHETVRINLSANLVKQLGRPQLVISGKVLDADRDAGYMAYLSDLTTDEEDIELSCNLHIEESKDLGFIDFDVVQKSNHPSVCAIEYREKNSLSAWSFGCTASLVESSQILTAAHCGEYYHDKDTRVHCGEDAKRVGIKRWRMNPDYRPQTHAVDNSKDIALADLSEPLASRVLEIEFDVAAAQKMILGEKGCTHYGMGRRQNNTIGAQYSSQFKFPPEILGGESFVRRSLAVENMIASHPSRFLRPGDSGGPLVCLNENNREVIVGVHSFLSIPSTSARSAMLSQSFDFLKQKLGTTHY